MNTRELEKYMTWIGILVLGSMAVTLGSFPIVFRHVFALGFVILLIVVRISPQLKTYIRVLDSLFVFVLIWHLPYLSIYKKLLTLGKDIFYWAFGKNDAVSHVADNSMSGLFWILFPILLVVLERDSLKVIFLRKGKKEGWIVGGIILLILLAVALVIILRSDLDFSVYLFFLPLGITFAIINAFKEEFLYRGLIFGRTLQFGFVYALLCQFLWFALIHILYSGAAGKSLGMFMGVGIFSLLSAWLTKKFDSLACPILIHTGIDFIIFVSSIPGYVNP